MQDPTPLCFSEDSQVDINSCLSLLIESGIRINTVSSNDLDLEDSLLKILGKE